MSKLSKLLGRPGEFWRDFFLNRYPEKLGENLETTSRGGPQKKQIAGSVRHHEIEPFPVNFPIDIVYTWVDGSDPIWLQKKVKLQNRTAECASVVTNAARFCCRGELKYSLRSISAYAPWVNKIYIVTDKQVPKWLDTNSEKIVIIDHEEIIPKEYLPTFNSHVIEAHLHKIPNLSEHYIYFNDDVMLTRPASPEHFFGGNGNAHLFITRSQTPVGVPSIYDSPTQKAAKNVRILIQEAFGQYLVFNYAHTFHTQLKSVNEEISKKWHSRFSHFLDNRFRGENDLALATYLFPNYAYLTGKADVRQTSCMYFNIRAASAQRRYTALLEKKSTSTAPYSMCLNDVHTRSDDDSDREREETQFLEQYFPFPSEFEMEEFEQYLSLFSQTSIRTS